MTVEVERSTSKQKSQDQQLLAQHIAVSQLMKIYQKAQLFGQNQALRPTRKD